MNIKAYLKGCQRGQFNWSCIESGTYGDGNTIDKEETLLEGRIALITRRSSNCFEAEIDNLKNDPYYDEREFTSRLNARKWCEKMIRNDIKISE